MWEKYERYQIKCGNLSKIYKTQIQDDFGFNLYVRTTKTEISSLYFKL